MIDIKKHIKQLNWILFSGIVITLFTIILAFIGRQRLQSYFPNNVVEILDYVRLIGYLIVSIFSLFLIYLNIFKKISINRKGFVPKGFIVRRAKNLEYYADIIIFFTAGLIFLYLFITNLRIFL